MSLYDYIFICEFVGQSEPILSEWVHFLFNINLIDLNLTYFTEIQILKEFM